MLEKQRHNIYTGTLLFLKEVIEKETKHVQYIHSDENSRYHKRLNEILHIMERLNDEIKYIAKKHEDKK